MTTGTIILTEDQQKLIKEETLKKLIDAEAKLTILKALSEVSAKTGSDLNYTGSDVQLINTPTTELPTGYTVKYAVTTDKTAPTEESAYSTDIPAKTEAGTYYVWYKVSGEGDLGCAADVPIAVTITRSSGGGGS